MSPTPTTRQLVPLEPGDTRPDTDDAPQGMRWETDLELRRRIERTEDVEGDILANCDMAYAWNDE